MAVPTRAQQIKAVEALLDSDATEGMTLTEVATKIVNGYHDMLEAGIKQASPPLHVGLAFKSPTTGKVQHVAWAREDLVWIVSAGTRYGHLGSASDPLWAYTEPTNAKAGAPGSNPHWNVGDEVTLSQRKKRYRIVATHDKCVLMVDVSNDEVQADSNDNLAKFYRKAT